MAAIGDGIYDPSKKKRLEESRDITGSMIEKKDAARIETLRATVPGAYKKYRAGAEAIVNSGGAKETIAKMFSHARYREIFARHISYLSYVESSYNEAITAYLIERYPELGKAVSEEEPFLAGVRLANVTAFSGMEFKKAALDAVSGEDIARIKEEAAKTITGYFGKPAAAYFLANNQKDAELEKNGRGVSVYEKFLKAFGSPDVMAGELLNRKEFLINYIARMKYLEGTNRGVAGRVVLFKDSGVLDSKRLGRVQEGVHASQSLEYLAGKAARRVMVSYSGEKGYDESAEDLKTSGGPCLVVFGTGDLFLDPNPAGTSDIDSFLLRDPETGKTIEVGDGRILCVVHIPADDIEKALTAGGEKSKARLVDDISALFIKEIEKYNLDGEKMAILFSDITRPADNAKKAAIAHKLRKFISGHPRVPVKAENTAGLIEALLTADSHALRARISEVLEKIVRNDPSQLPSILKAVGTAGSSASGEALALAAGKAMVRNRELVRPVFEELSRAGSDDMRLGLAYALIILLKSDSAPAIDGPLAEILTGALNAAGSPAAKERLIQALSLAAADNDSVKEVIARKVSDEAAKKTTLLLGELLSAGALPPLNAEDLRAILKYMDDAVFIDTGADLVFVLGKIIAAAGDDTLRDAPEVLEAVKKTGLRYMDLRDGGDSYNTASSFARGVLVSLANFTPEELPERFPLMKSGEVSAADTERLTKLCRKDLSFLKCWEGLSYTRTARESAWL